MIFEALILIVGFYLFAGLSMYTYAVVKSWEILGFWDFSITRTHVAMMSYPRWMLFWLHIIVKNLKTKLNKG
jgi:hypothetical protein